MFIEILFKILLFKGGVLIYAEHCIYIYIYALLWFSKNIDTAMFSFTKHPHLVTVANIDKH